MLRYLRENTGNWIIKIFLGIIVIVFVFLGVGSFGSKRNDSVATINDEPITIKEYQRTYKMLVDQMRARFGKNLNDDILKALNVKQQALDSLIDERLVLLEAGKLGITISDEELQQSVLSIKAFQKDDNFNLEQYKKVLSLNSLTPETFEKSQINALRQQKVREMLFSSVNVSELEVRNWYLFQNTKTAIDYVKFDPADYADVKPDSLEIKKYYKENSENYKSDLKIQTKYLEFSPEDYKDEVSISDVMIKDYYQEHMQEFKTPEKVEARHILIKVEEDAPQEKVDSARKQAQDIYAMSVDGQDFQELAKKYSQGPSKESGGYLGKFEKNAMVKPFADKAFSMEKGEISEPVRTMFGWHIIKLVDRFDASTKTLEQVSKKIREELKTLEMQNMAYYKAGEAFDSVIDGDDFEQVALIADKKILTSSEFSIDGKGLELENNANAGFARAAFELPLDVISDIKQFGDSYYLIKTIKRVDPVILEFDLVKERVIDELRKKMQKEQAKKEAGLYLAKAMDTNTLEQLGKNKVKSTKLFTRSGSIEEVGNSDEFIKAGFSLNKDNKIYSEVIETLQGYYIIGFKERKTPEESEISENLENLKSQILRRKEAQSYQAWMAQLRKQNKITYDPQLLK
ncbi:MAG: SurA N-terminal domain-containing protein [Thermodesulfobacteriota bacterium]